MTAHTRRLLLALAILATLLLLVGVGPLPDASAPPGWLDRAAWRFTRELASTFLWSGTFVLLGVYEVLRTQRNDPETAAARWVRRLILSFAVLFLTFAAGRSVLREWETVGYAVGIGLATAAIVGTGRAMVVTYLVPVVRCWNNQCEHAPERGGAVVPEAKWDGVTERRVGPRDRRKGARTA